MCPLYRLGMKTLFQRPLYALCCWQHPLRLAADPDSVRVILCSLSLAQLTPSHRHSHASLTGSFSAASNVTGDLEDVDKVTATLHRSGALALWDYATAAPYVQVDMNPVASGSDDQVSRTTW